MSADTSSTLSMLAASGAADRLGVFISYSRDDIESADWLDVTLDNTGFAPTLDRQGISGAEDWRQRLGTMIRDADTVVFVLSQSSAKSHICKWEVEEAVRLGKRIVPVAVRPLDGVSPPPQLAALNYIFLYADQKRPGSSVKSGTAELVKVLRTDLAWMREHTRYLQRAAEWEAGGRPANRLLSGGDISIAKAWEARRPTDAPPLTALQLDYIRASEEWETRQQNEERQRLVERERLVREAEAALKEAAEAAKGREVARANEALASQRAAQNARLGLAVALALMFLAMGLGGMAWWQRNESQANAERAVAAQKVAEQRQAEAIRQSQIAQQNEKKAKQARSVIAGFMLITGTGKQNVQIRLRGDNNRVRIGEQVVFEVQSDVQGKLVLIDVPASYEATQIFPNAVSSKTIENISPGRPVVVPDSGYGFTSFQAVEPAGIGVVFAVVLPGDLSRQLSEYVAKYARQAFVPIGDVDEYLEALFSELKSKREALGIDSVGVGLATYEIVR